MSSESNTEKENTTDVTSVTKGVKNIAISERLEQTREPIPPVCRGISGEVKWFSLYNGYGFITRSDTGKDIFVHTSAIVRSGRFSSILTAGDKVEFDVIQGFKGPEAWTVTALNGQVIQTVRYIRRPFRRGVNGRYNNSSHMRKGEQRTENDDEKSQNREKSEENNNRRQLSPNEKNGDLTESDKKRKFRRFGKDSEHGGRKNGFRNSKSKRRDSKNENISDEKQPVVSTEKNVAINKTVVNEIAASA